MPTLPISGGTPAVISGFAPEQPIEPSAERKKGVRFVYLNPIQIVGLVPLTSCTAVECRTYCECLVPNPVFGVIGITTSTYENDWNTFLVDYSLFTPNTVTGVTATFILQQKQGASWVDVATLNNNVYGIFYNFNTIANHPSYKKFEINWGKVLQFQGEGLYRIKLTSSFKTLSECLVSEQFCLKTFSCLLAHSTTKFEVTISGKRGSATVDGRIYDLCFDHFDSIRMKGMFGFETGEYEETLLEWGSPKHGKVESIRGEFTKKFQWKSSVRGLPKWLLDRFKVYALLSPKILLVSDYNWNNSDYDIRQKNVVRESGFAPEYRVNSRLSKVVVDFGSGIKSIIASNCCDVTQTP